MEQLQDKTHMDEEAERALGRIKNKVEAVLNLFLRNRNTGTTDALKSAIVEANSPILLSGDTEMGRKIIADMTHDILNDQIQEKLKHRTMPLGWSSIEKVSEKTHGGRSVQLIPDNSFMLRAFDTIASAIDFFYSEIKRLQKQNEDLRQANDNLAKANAKANKKMKQLENKQKELSERVETLQDKLNSFRNGE